MSVLFIHIKEFYYDLWMGIYFRDVSTVYYIYVYEIDKV